MDFMDSIIVLVSRKLQNHLHLSVSTLTSSSDINGALNQRTNNNNPMLKKFKMDADVNANLGSSSPKDDFICVDHPYTCIDPDVGFTCGDGLFECGSRDQFICGGEGTILFSCRIYQGLPYGFICHIEPNQTFKCDSAMFGCWSEENASPFTCPSAAGFDFDCTNTTTYDFWCGGGQGIFDCDSDITSGFFCQANHVFKCDWEFGCSNMHNCSPSRGVCKGDWNPVPPEYDDGWPSDFRCDNVFSCGQNGESPTGDFSCMAMSEFICGSSGNQGVDFDCHNNFVCHPTDGPYYHGEGEAFGCVDGAFDCESGEFDCTGATDKFRCYAGYSCDKEFDCADFYCDTDYLCRPCHCPIPEPGSTFDAPQEDKFNCDDFKCDSTWLNGFRCNVTSQFGGCQPPSDFECEPSVPGFQPF